MATRGGAVVAERETREHIGGLDGLRALAALAVFGVHFNQIAGLDGQFGALDIARVFANGDHGVSLFFTLSGFLLGLPYWRALSTGEAMPDLRVYAVRRAARIFPAYYAALTVLVLASGLWRVPGAIADVLLHYTFLFNYTEFSIFSINAPFWTLAVEIQFYLLLPLLFLALRGLGPGRALVAVLALCPLAYGAHFWLVASVERIVTWPPDPWLPWIRPYGAVLTHSLLAHLPHFLFGVAGGWAFVAWRAGGPAPSRRSEAASEIAFWLCLALATVLVASGLEDDIGVPYGRYGLPVVPMLLAVMILAATGSRGARACLESAPLRLMGVVSYGIYIYHVPCLNGVDWLMRGYGLEAPEHRLLFAVSGLALTLGVASVSYLSIERPVLRLARRVR
jgi:peptidoglycan/LPS O-acetylase OafA/YrhL